MVWWYEFVLVAHLTGVFLLVAAMALQATVSVLMRRATRVGDVRAALNLSRRLPRLFGPATVLIVASGIYLTLVLVRAHALWLWAMVSFAALVALAAWGAIEGRRRNRRYAQLLGEGGGKISPALRAALDSASPVVHAAFGAWIVAAILVLMVYQPGLWFSLAVVAVALLAAFVTRRWLCRHLKRKMGKDRLANKLSAG